MKTLETLGITAIKCENKANNEEVKEIHYGVNQIIFDNLKRPISFKRALRIKNAFIDAGKKLKAIETSNDSVMAKKNEILSKLKDYFFKLQDYTSVPTNDDGETMEKVVKYQVSKYLRKKDDWTMEELIRLLKENKEIGDDYLTTVPSLIKTQNEILDRIKKEFEIN